MLLSKTLPVTIISLLTKIVLKIKLILKLQTSFSFLFDPIHYHPALEHAKWAPSLSSV